MDLAGDEGEFVFRWPGPIRAVHWRPRFAPVDGAWRIMVERNKNQRSNARDGSVHRVKFVELLRQVLDEVPDVGHFRSTDDAEVDRVPVAALRLPSRTDGSDRSPPLAIARTSRIPLSGWRITPSPPRPSISPLGRHRLRRQLGRRRQDLLRLGTRIDDHHPADVTDGS